MNCKDAQELILTDYLDGEAKRQAREAIEEHLAACAACREFHAVVSKVAKEPFVNAGRMTPPVTIWQNVKSAIAAEEERKRGFLSGILERLKHTFYIPNPAVAVATALMIIILFGVATKFLVSRQDSSAGARPDEAYYADYLAEPSDENGFGTSIEKYFL